MWFKESTIQPTISLSCPLFSNSRYQSFHNCDVRTHGPNKRGKILFYFLTSWAHFRTNTKKGPKIPKKVKSVKNTDFTYSNDKSVNCSTAKWRIETPQFWGHIFSIFSVIFWFRSIGKRERNIYLYLISTFLRNVINEKGT